MTTPGDKPKKAVDQKTLDMLAKGRAARAANVAAKKAGTPATAETKPDDKPGAPAPKATRCMSCYSKPCDKSGKRCPK